MKCNICEIGCSMAEGKTGSCGRYKNENGVITELFPDSYLVVCPISAETMPIMNYYPKAKFLQISTSGCNFDCSGCVATVVAKEVDADSRALKKLSPEQIIERAVKEECMGIAFLMNDPLASFHTFMKIAKLAKEKGLLVGCSSNGYFTEHSLNELAQYLDFINIGIKGLSDADYKSCGAHSYTPVIRNIKLLYDKGVHVEVACMHKKNEDHKLMEIAETVANISKDIPLQIMRFIPLGDADMSDEPTIKESENAHRQASKILDYVYLFNTPGTDCINTYCPDCGELIFDRDFYGPMGSKLRTATITADDRKCPKCGRWLDIKGSMSKKTYDENDFEGGYPFTRALEIIEGTLAAIGVKDRKQIVACWEDTLKDGGLPKFHGNIQDFDNYAKKIGYFGKLTGREAGAQKLVKYMREKVEYIASKTSEIIDRPRVYYVMGKPLFALEDGRLENHLAEMAGGISINNSLGCDGRPGMKITADRLNSLNPDVIFISSFMHCSIEDFAENCRELGIDVDAVRNGRIYNHPMPCIDFGSPRWILGLMHVANCLHPDIFSYDIHAEAELFYNEFYGIDYIPEEVNRSFARPSRNWELVL